MILVLVQLTSSRRGTTLVTRSQLPASGTRHRPRPVARHCSCTATRTRVAAPSCCWRYRPHRPHAVAWSCALTTSTAKSRMSFRAFCSASPAPGQAPTTEGLLVQRPLPPHVADGLHKGRAVARAPCALAAPTRGGSRRAYGSVRPPPGRTHTTAEYRKVEPFLTAGVHRDHAVAWLCSLASQASRGSRGRAYGSCVPAGRGQVHTTAEWLTWRQLRPRGVDEHHSSRPTRAVCVSNATAKGCAVTYDAGGRPPWPTQPIAV